MPQGQVQALADYLMERPGWRQLQVKDCDPLDLKLARSSCGIGDSPYHCEGDFNIDGQKDFAVILVHKNPPVDTGLTGSHQWQYKLRIVVFNGKRDGGFGHVFSEDADAPLACFLHVTSESAGRLHFGVLETCSGFLLTPMRNGYRMDLPP